MPRPTMERERARSLTRPMVLRPGTSRSSGTRTTVRDHREGQRSATTGYEPRRYAFRFPNDFVNVVWSGRLPPGIGKRVEWSTDGRCGGMAFASLDFFHLRIPVPPLTPSNFAGSTVPPDGHPLADYIYRRQLRSMIRGVRGARDGLRFIRWSKRSTDTLVVKTHGEIRKIVKSIDAGEPVVLGLIKATNAKVKNLGDNHQVVCYGYRTDDSGHFEFLIYEPNEPYDSKAPGDYEVVLGRRDNFASSTFPYRSTRPGRTEDWRGFFVQRYRPNQPNRRVIDAGGTTGGSDGRGGGGGGGGGGIPDPDRPPEHLK
jgi:hypothetical protein